MREFNSKELDDLDFVKIYKRLKNLTEGDLVFEEYVMMPEADILCCRYKGKRFVIKIDLGYGPSIDSSEDIPTSDVEGIVRILKSMEN